MSKPNLNTLPPESIVDILRSFDSYNDLQSLNTSSAVCYRLSKAYSKSIYQQIALNILGEETWKTASKVLVYQRNSSPGYDSTISTRTAIKEDFARPFTLQKRDIAQLVANQRFLDSCANSYNYENYHNDFYRPSSQSIFPAIVMEWKPFPMTLFYRVWLMSFQLEYESIDTLARYNPLIGDADYESLCLMCKVMGKNRNAGEFGCIGRSWVAEKIRSSDFFTLIALLPTYTSETYECNPPLIMKMINHLRVITTNNVQFWQMYGALIEDYQTVRVDELVTKYKFDRYQE